MDGGDGAGVVDQVRAVAVALAVVRGREVEVEGGTGVAEQHAGAETDADVVGAAAEEARDGEADVDGDVAADLVGLAGY